MLAPLKASFAANLHHRSAQSALTNFRMTHSIPFSDLAGIVDRMTGAAPDVKKENTSTFSTSGLSQ
jgi:hypothetical protein